MDNQPSHPIAIGGIGGSGTRVGALVLKLMDYYIGDDLNESMDNLWFTLLFKRRSILLESRDGFNRLATLFFARMSGDVEAAKAARSRVLRLAGQDRLQHSREWLLERASSFCDPYTSYRTDQAWGWKEPNTHIIIDRLLEFNLKLKYIHITRHPIDMALSSNQNQLSIWGPIFLISDFLLGPRSYLSYWCAVHRRITEIRRSWPERVIIIDVEVAWTNPGLFCSEIAGFTGASLSSDLIFKFAGLVRRPVSAGRYRGVSLGQFAPEDLAYVAALGYELPL